MRAPDCVATPGNTIMKFDPSDEIWAWMAACEPWPTPIIAITQATPMMMPSAVSIDRILLRAIAAIPTLRMVMNFSMSTPPLPASRASSRQPAIRDRPVFHHLAVAEHDHPLGVLGDVRLVGDEDDRLAGVVELLEDADDLLGGLR